MKKITQLLLFFAFLFLLIGCVTSDKSLKNNNEITKTEKGVEENLLKKIREINNNSPKYISTSVKILGKQNRKKFKVYGKAFFDKNQNSFYLKISDFIFRSHISSVYLKNDNLFFYFPVEKTLYRDSIKTVKLKNYIDVNFDFNILYKLFVGKIPLIPGSVFKKCTIEDEKNCDNLILENDKFIQRISFKNGRPDRILYFNKVTKTKVEVYLTKGVAYGKTFFYKKIRIKSKGDSVDITYQSLKVDKKLKISSVDRIMKRKKLKIIEMR